MLLWHTDIEGTEGTEGTDTEGAGGKVVLPALLAVAGVIYIGAQIAGQIADVAVDSADLIHDKSIEHARMVENERFWSDYERNTGVKVKYPHRTGAYTDWTGYNIDYMQGVLRLYNDALRLF